MKRILILLWLVLSPSLLSMMVVAGSTMDSFHQEIRDIGPLWTYRTGDGITSSPTVFDINEDGNPEIIFGSLDGNLYVLDSEGSKIWAYKTDGRIASSPVIMYPSFDSRYYQRLEIVFGSWDGNLYALNASGNRTWGYRTLGEIEFPPVIADADSDGRPEVIFGSNDNTVYGIDHMREKIWMYSVDSDIVPSPVVADIDKDGKPEIIIGSRDGGIYCLYYSKYEEGNITYARIAQRWNYTVDDQVEPSLSVADLDNDGNPEIIFGFVDREHYIVNQGIHILNKDGRVIERYTTSGRVISSPAIADLDDDEQLEVIVGTNRGMLYIINSSGFAEWSYNLSGSIGSSPAIADLNGDGALEILVASGDSLYVFGSVKDSDGDGLRDCDEFLIGTDLRNNDTDGDGLIDSIDPHPLEHELTLVDSDGDGLNDYDEIIVGTDLRDNDTDGDGLIDSIDPHPLEHELTLVDSDGDGLNDYDEIIVGTDLRNNDTDGDGLIDSIDPHPLEHESISKYYSEDESSNPKDKENLSVMILVVGMMGMMFVVRRMVDEKPSTAGEIMREEIVKIKNELKELEEKLNEERDMLLERYHGMKKIEDRLRAYDAALEKEVNRAVLEDKLMMWNALIEKETS